MVVGYCRVSTLEQSIDRQYETMKFYKVEKVFEEKISGKNALRPKLQEMLEFVREGDCVVVHDFSRLARSTVDLLHIVETLTHKGVQLISSKEQIDTSTPTGKLILTVLGSIHEFERTSLLEKQAEGIAIAKAKGVYKGRKPIEIDNFSECYEKWKCREVSKADLMKELGITRPTLNKLFREYEQTLETKAPSTI